MKKGSTTSIIIAVCLIALMFLFSYDFIKKDQNSSSPQTEPKAVKSARFEAINKLSSYEESVENMITTVLPGIVCWGDSLTAGAGGNGTRYPDVLQERIHSFVSNSFNAHIPTEKAYSKLINEADFGLPDIPIINMGVGGEDTITILGRNGAIPFVVKDPFTIPESTDLIPITFISQSGQSVAPLRQGNRGMEWVSIAGVEGVIFIEQEDWRSPDYKYFFSRTEKGTPVAVASGTEIITSGSIEYPGYLPVIFMGHNGGYSDIPTLIEQQLAIINHQAANRDRFIIVGEHCGTAAERAELEQAMLTQYGDKYINLRQYMSTQALQDAGIEPTPEDIKAMETGSTPPSLLSDTVHFNATGYRLLGNLIFQRMYDLGYFAEIESAISSFTF